MKRSFLIFTICILLLPLFLNSFTAWASSANLSEVGASVKLTSLEITKQEEPYLQSELKLSYTPVEENIQIDLKVSDNFQISAGEHPITDEDTGESLGTYRATGQTLELHFNATETSNNAKLILEGSYQPESGNIKIEESPDNSVEGIVTPETSTIDSSELSDESESTENSATEESATTETIDSEEDAVQAVVPQAFSLENLQFAVELNELEIVDGTDSFDIDDTPGNDSGSNNGIIRSFDTIMYPIKITLNDTSGGTIHNIKVKITGTLPNGIVDGRTNAVFGENSQNDYDNSMVSYDTEYEIASTGTAVTYPIPINVLGAENGLLLTPEFHVQLISVDGVDVSGENIRYSFTDIQPRHVSSRVSIEPKISSGAQKFASQTIRTVAYDKNDRTVPLGIELMAVPLPGKSDIKGSAFPTENLSVDLSMTGRVVWDDGITTNFDFTGNNRPPLIVDYHNYVVNSGPNSIISSNPKTLSNVQNVEYNQLQFNDTRSYWAGSKMTDKATYDALNAIWDSGTYQLNDFDLTNPVTFSIQDYKIGPTYPIRRADGYTGRTIYNGRQKVFTNQNVDLLVANDYAYGGSLNTDAKENTVYYTATLSYVDENSQEKKAKTEFSIRNEVPGVRGYLSANFKNPDTKRPFGKYSIANDIDPYGDGQTVSGSRVLLAGGGGFGDSPNEGGYQFLQKWNTDAFQLTARDIADNATQIRGAGVFGSIGTPATARNYWYGISKRSDANTIQGLAQATVEDYTWYPVSALTADQYASVGAILMDTIAPVARTWKYGGTYITAVTERLGSQTNRNTPNIYVAEMAVFRDANRDVFDPTNPSASQNDSSRYSISENYPVFSETKYDTENKLTALQEPVNGHTKFDTLGIVPVKVSNAITSDKDSYRSTETVHWQINENGLLASNNYHSTDEIIWTVTLPKGISYLHDSGKYGATNLEPTVVTNEDGTQTLIFRVTAVSTPDATATLEEISFDTQFDDINIEFVNNHADLTVTSVISTDKDTSDEELRKATDTINVIRIGRLGIYEQITPAKGEVHGDYTLSIFPYTTSLKEPNVRGLLVLPSNNDVYGSEFSGTSQLKLIEANLEANQNMNIYINSNQVPQGDPNAVDISTGGWELYTGQSLANIQSIWYEFQQDLSPGDQAEIHLTLMTHGNQHDDYYRHRTYGNSGTNYKTPVQSNMVEHRIYGRQLGGFVWLDANKDGLRQAETNIANVPVKLYRRTKTGYELVRENLRGESLENIVTDNEGEYLFTYLPAGIYSTAFDYTCPSLSNMEVTSFNIGDESINSKVDPAQQAAINNCWNTTDCRSLPELADLTTTLYEQKYLNLGVYPKTTEPNDSGNSGSSSSTSETEDSSTSTTTSESNSEDSSSSSSTITSETDNSSTSTTTSESEELPNTSIPSESNNSNSTSANENNSIPVNSVSGGDNNANSSNSSGKLPQTSERYNKLSLIAGLLFLGMFTFLQFFKRQKS